MKKVFSPIGRFFKAIWRWIKETAWVQPLLIVGLIFGLIFSIQPISNAISSLADSMSSSDRIYRRNRVTLYRDKADQLINDPEVRFEDDEKYFLAFVASDCAQCHLAHQGFNELLNRDTYTGDYRIKAIYTDEDGAYDINDNDDLFVQLFFENDNFREAIGQVAENSMYAVNVGYDQNLDNIKDGSDCPTPLILLMDKEAYDQDPDTFGIKEVLIGVVGNTAIERANFLDDAWNGTGDFE